MANVEIITISGTVGTSPVQILSNIIGQNIRLRVINPTNSHFLAATYDNGSTAPVIGSVGAQITPYGIDEVGFQLPAWSLYQIGVYLVADAAGVPYTIEAQSTW